ncbi:hypothetical protein OH76DRAFT_528139 [Lentinus brumalis]|uniref:Uncharacterized protein n=1 Tax=Lentinus brumalis TaxID=2498619 RepID=A0A371DA51_9APHY|nr:hypothetical protein OH76DRAFT_528139 [Polyporus brumalis]
MSAARSINVRGERKNRPQSSLHLGHGAPWKRHKPLPRPMYRLLPARLRKLDSRLR